MSRDLFTAQDKDKADASKTYGFRDVIVRESNAFIDAYSLQVDGSVSAVVHISGSIKLLDYKSQTDIADGSTVVLAEKQLWLVYSDEVSTAVDDQGLVVELKDAGGEKTWNIHASLTVVSLAFRADFDRNGMVDAAAPQSRGWTWGAKGEGAVLLVNSDRDSAYPNRYFRDRLDRRVNGPLDIEDMTEVALTMAAPQGLDLSVFAVRLRVSDAGASRVRVFDCTPAVTQAVIGPGIPIASWPAERGKRELRFEGLDYPDAGFTGLITSYCELMRNGELYGTDKLVLRVAPWLALPNTQRARTLYIAEMADGSNQASIDGIKRFAKAADVKLVIVPPVVNRADRWLQDEIEIGYAQMPSKTIPVVLDSPRNRELDDFSERMLLGPDFGYVTRGNDEQASSLDSFGNLDCTPPHVGPKGAYPFGRIIFGGALPGAPQSRRMMKVVSDFMYAQQVQYPIELYSDWLNVGHIDEFMSFVPTTDARKFRLVLASPATSFRLLKELQTKGHGATKLMVGKQKEITVDALLDRKKLLKQNDLFQKHIDWNKAVLVREMGLTPSDIIHLPALYTAEGPRADAFFPGMVNMQVANGHLAIPKPFGPVIDGVCAFERVVQAAFEPLGLKCHFIDTFKGYHLAQGEIHCGTNVVREPFAQPWWEFDPAVNAG